MNINRTYKVSNLNKTYNQTNKIIAATTQIRAWDVWDYSLLVLLVIAVIGNTLTILVMRSKKMRKTNTSLFLTCMAIADISVLSLKFLVFLQKLYKIPLYEFCVIVNFLPDIAAFTSYWLIMITTIERCIAVWYPLKVTQIVTKQRCLILVFILIIFFALISSTQIFCLEKRMDAPHYCKIKGSEGKGIYFTYQRMTYPYIKSALMSWIPSVLGIILNALIIFALTKASKKRHEMSTKNRKNDIDLKSILVKQKNQSIKENVEFKISKFNSQSELELATLPLNQENVEEKNNKYVKVTRIFLSQISQERQITIMLISISLTFLILTLPFSIHELLRKLYPTEQKFKDRFTQRFVLFLLDCLHATNFLLYCLVGKKFRDQLKIILRCKIDSQDKNLGKTSSTYVTNYVSSFNQNKNNYI